MQYRLKDHELQRKLDEISDGDFSARLHKERELIKDSFQNEPRLHVLWFGEGSQFSAALYADMLEEVREYDPHKWNEYPEVTPPKPTKVPHYEPIRCFHYPKKSFSEILTKNFIFVVKMMAFFVSVACVAFASSLIDDCVENVYAKIAICVIFTAVIVTLILTAIEVADQ